MWSITDVVGFFFDFFEPGGTNNLLPGRPLEQSQAIQLPRGAGFMVSINSIEGAFVTGNGLAFLTQRPFGKFQVRTGVRNGNSIVCQVRLTDENMDDAIRIRVRGSVLVFA
jgi:hypothetical protein